MAKLSPKLFQSALPLACQWSAEQERSILEHGREPSLTEREDARKAGVSLPARIRVLQVQTIPSPQDSLLKEANEQLGLIGPAFLALTIHYGIFLHTELNNSRKTLIHNSPTWPNTSAWEASPPS